MNCTCYTQKENVINGRHVWLYLIAAPIGHIIVVDYEEAADPKIVRKLFDENYEAAEKYFNTICRKKLAGLL